MAMDSTALMDSFGRSLLKELQDNARLSVAELARRVGLSANGQHYFRLMEFVQTLEEVRECHHLTGGDAFLLKVTTTSMSGLEALIEALLPYGNPVTSLVLSTPIERRKFAITGKLTSVTTKKKTAWSTRR